MTIEYALTRTEVARSYLKSLSGSPQFRLRIFVIAAVLAGFHMMLHAVTTHSFASGDIVGGVIVFAIVLAALPVLLFLMAKRDKRSLTIGPEGISTRIGSQSGQVPWRHVRIVTDGGSFILLARNTGNAFFIPNRAFATPAERARFLEEVKRLRG